MAIANEAPVAVHLPDVDTVSRGIDDIVGAIDGFSGTDFPSTTVLCDMPPTVAVDLEEVAAVIDPGFVVGIDLQFD